MWLSDAAILREVARCGFLLARNLIKTVCVSVCVSVCNALIFESLDLSNQIKFINAKGPVGH